MTDEEFEDLPYGTEGLWRKLMHASRQYASLEQIAAATKSKNKASQQHKIGKKTTAPDAQQITAIAESGKEEGETGENSNVLSEIAKNFDLRSAVIYSEIMTPKFKENE